MADYQELINTIQILKDSLLKKDESLQEKEERIHMLEAFLQQRSKKVSI